MTDSGEDVERAVEERRVWLDQQLAAAAAELAVTVIGEPVNTYDMRSAGATAQDNRTDASGDGGGDCVWLRVVVEVPDYEPACRWNGNVAANSIHGVRKPRVLRWHDWVNTDDYLEGRQLRGEVMTLAPGATVAPDGVLHGDPRLPDTWWDDLRRSLDALAAHPLDWNNELNAVNYTIRGVEHQFGVTLPSDAFAELEWTTAHADLHWGNLRGPELCILDWESWRPAPAGYDLATLYCSSLLHEPTATRIGAMPELQTRTGRLAVLSAICRYLSIVGEGSDYDLLDDRLRGEARVILTELAKV